MITLTTLLMIAAVGDVEVSRASPKHPRVVLAPRATPDATLRIVFTVGAADDETDAGKTRIAQHLLLRGAKGYEAFRDALYAGGGELAMTTGIRECTFELTAPRAAFDKLAPQLVRMTLSPIFWNERYERARRVAVGDALDVGSDEDMFGYVASRVLLEDGPDNDGDFDAALHGEAGAMQKMSMQVVHAHIKQRFVPANAIVVAAGGFDAGALKKALAGASGGAEKVRAPPTGKRIPRDVARWSPSEVRMRIFQLDVDKSAASAAALHVVSALLADALPVVVRRAGEADSESVRVELAALEWTNALVVRWTSSPKEGAGNAAAAAVLDAIDEVAAGSISAEQLARAKALARTRLALLDDDPRALARVAQLWAAHAGTVVAGKDVRAAIDTVDVAAVKNAAAHALGRERMISAGFGHAYPKAKSQTAGGE